tara:strand:+ start:9677 stop:10333 length:657 start_codon:yes stop_codon:yes gene_type:complete
MLNKLKKWPKKYKKSYSQQGEDLTIEFIMRIKNIENPYYLDIGSNHPISLSNTYLFYKLGGKGVCVEPNPVFNKLYKKHRPKDKFINAGISPSGKGEATFYIMDWHEFSTFDKNHALKVQEQYKGRNNIKEEISLPLISLENLYKELERKIDLLSLDVEGLDYDILKAWDFYKYAPAIICIECKDLKTGEHDQRISQFLLDKGYKLEAFNQINSIYCK